MPAATSNATLIQTIRVVDENNFIVKKLWQTCPTFSLKNLATENQ